MNTIQMKDHIASGALDEKLAYVYGEGAVTFQKERYTKAIDEFAPYAVPCALHSDTCII